MPDCGADSPRFQRAGVSARANGCPPPSEPVAPKRRADTADIIIWGTGRGVFRLPARPRGYSKRQQNGSIKWLTVKDLPGMLLPVPDGAPPSHCPDGRRFINAVLTDGPCTAPFV